MWKDNQQYMQQYMQQNMQQYMQRYMQQYMEQYMQQDMQQYMQQYMVPSFISEWPVSFHQCGICWKSEEPGDEALQDVLSILE